MQDASSRFVGARRALRTLRQVVLAGAVAAGALGMTTVSAAFDSVVIQGPTGSQYYATEYNTLVLANDNIVVSDSRWDDGTATDVGAVYIYSSTNGALINRLTGGSSGDMVGTRIIELNDGKLLVWSPYWNGSRGAVTWMDGATGVSGTVSSANSLVGDTADDQVGSGYIRVLTNGNYVVVSPSFDDGANADVGAVTWGNGATGITGVVSSTNSLVGATAADGYDATTSQQVWVIPLTNGAYVSAWPSFDKDGMTDVGAVVWSTGTVGITGVVNADMATVGESANDRVGYYDFEPGSFGTSYGTDGVYALDDGNYMLVTPDWGGGRGAATWWNGNELVTGTVNTDNSVFGNSMSDQFGSGGLQKLSNGNVLIFSKQFGDTKGAVTWLNGSNGRDMNGQFGVASAQNSLVGAQSTDYVGYDINGVQSSVAREVGGGRFVVMSTAWDNPDNSQQDAGALTWGSITAGISGTISAENSLIGQDYQTFYGDNSQFFKTYDLGNGAFVLLFRQIRLDGSQKDAAMWVTSTVMLTGTISSTNALLSGVEKEIDSVMVLPNSNYLVVASRWNGARGAVTLGDGANGTVGVISSTNSVVGGTAGDAVGWNLTAVMSNGTYLLGSDFWDSPTATNVGAWRVMTMSQPTAGVLDTSNSIVGTAAGDRIGQYKAIVANGFLLGSENWDNGTITDVGAFTWVPAAGMTGVVTVGNSFIGARAGDKFGSGLKMLSSDARNIVIISPNWNNRRIAKAGAVTVLPADRMVIGTVSYANSIVGRVKDDFLSAMPYRLSSGEFGVGATGWDDPDAGVVNRGAILRLRSDQPSRGAVSVRSGYVVTGVTTSSGTSSQVNPYDWFGSGASYMPGGRLLTLWPTDSRYVMLGDRTLDDASLNDFGIYSDTASYAVTPGFHYQTHYYTATVNTAVVTMTAYQNDAGAVLTLAASAGGCVDYICPLVPGVNTITATVTAANGSTVDHYWYNITRSGGPSTDASLSNLTAAPAVLSPAFVSGTTSYTSTVANATTSVTVIPTTTDVGATTALTSSPNSCSGSACTLSVGVNVITVTVTAANGTTTRTYVLEITREPSAPVIASVWPRIGVSAGGMPVAVLGEGFTGATTVTVDGAPVAFTMSGDGRIDFVMPARVSAYVVDITVSTPRGTVTAVGGFTYVDPVMASVDAGTGGVFTATGGLTVTIPPQVGISGTLVVTLTPASPSAAAPGSLLLHSFVLSATLNGLPVDVTNGMTIELSVDSNVIPSGQLPWLFQSIPNSSGGVQWVPVGHQSYSAAAGKVRSTVAKMTSYVVSAAALDFYYMPVVFK
jgi:hypothetical protein